MSSERDASLDIASLTRRYADGEARPQDVAAEALDRADARGDDGVWISRVARDEVLAAASALGQYDGRPLWGVPFAVKDNIDVAGMDTTAACAAFAYRADRSATIVERLVAAGAILVGKTNLDQFATGLSGVRSPYGVPANPFDPALIAGGSSSGSAVAVAAGLVSFALGTDTAGSGRVPAAFTNTVGVKPSRGLASTAGIVPACRSLDCPSVFSLTVADGAAALSAMAGPDPLDPWSRALPIPPGSPQPAALDGAVVAVPRRDQVELDHAVGYPDAWDSLVDRLRAAGAEVRVIDLDPFLEAGRLLYGGPWIAERLAGLEEFLDSYPEAVHPVTLEVLLRGRDVSGAQAFRGIARLEELRAHVRAALAPVDALLTPTAPTITTVAAMLADPVDLNMRLGRYSTFVNLLDLAAVAVPAGFAAGGVPFGVTVHGLAGSDAALAGLARAFEQLAPGALGATRNTPPLGTVPDAGPTAPAGTMPVAVVGAHLRGMPLHSELTSRGAIFARATATSADYTLFALGGPGPARPGLVRVTDGGSAIAVEVYHLPADQVGGFLASVPAPLGLGTVTLIDGSAVTGFVCEAYATAGARDITSLGGWRAFVTSEARG